MRRPALALGLLLLAGCSSQPSALGVVASSPGSLGVGEQRVLFALIDQESNEYAADPERDATVTVRNEDGAPLDTYPLDFLWTIPDVRGLYVANVDIPEAATYQVTIDAEGYAITAPAGLAAVADPEVAQIGDEAPASVTRTSDDYPDLSVISSDSDPDPAMYQVSVAEAVSNGTPALVIFATPAWCRSQTCGPMLDQVKALRPQYQGVDFVHVEVYEDIQVSTFEELVLVDAVLDWGLLAEPWVFVVDEEGVITASFEGAASDEELRAALDAVAS